METVVKAAIVLAVMVVLIFIFMRLFGKSACTADGYIDQTRIDTDNDGVVDAVDQCCEAAASGEVNAWGCAPEQAKKPCPLKPCKEAGK